MQDSKKRHTGNISPLIIGGVSSSISGLSAFVLAASCGNLPVAFLGAAAALLGTITAVHGIADAVTARQHRQRCSRPSTWTL